MVSKGDNLEYNGQEIATYQDLRRTAFFEKVMDATVLRDGSKKLIALEKELGQILIDEGIRSPFNLMFPSVIDSIDPGSNAEIAGLKSGDRIMSVNGFETGYQLMTKSQLADKKSEPILLTVDRKGKL